MAKKTNNKDFAKTMDKRFEQVKNVASDANKFVYETADEIVDGAVKRGEEWQGVAEKAIKGGLKLASNQQDLVFDTLEVVKGQFKAGTKRFRALFSNN